MLQAVNLESNALLNAIYGVDLHIVRLEEKVKEQQEEIENLNKQISDRNQDIMQESWNKVGSTLSVLLDHAEGKPPINEDMGLDTVLILKHLESVISRARNGMTTYGYAIFEIEKYVKDAMKKATEISEGSGS